VPVLAYPKFQLNEDEIRELLDSYLLYVDAIDVPDDLGARLPSCRDAQDQVLLELAAFGDAETPVTGDRDLLTLAGQVDFAIQSPRQFQNGFSAG
jgi:predicted nucleic acid-binding protein